MKYIFKIDSHILGLEKKKWNQFLLLIRSYLFNEIRRFVCKICFIVDPVLGKLTTVSYPLLFIFIFNLLNLFFWLYVTFCQDGRGAAGGTDHPTTKKDFWGSAVPRKKNATHFEEMQSQYQEIASVLERVATRTVSLLTADVKTRKLVGVSREIMWSSWKSFDIPARVLCKRIDAMWDILLKKKETVEKQNNSPRSTRGHN